MFSAIPRNSITSARASITSYPSNHLATRMARFYRVYSSIIVNIRSVLPSCVIHALPVGLGLYSARFNFAILRARFALASHYRCLWAPACCTERIDFSRWSSQLSASSSETKETQKEKEATTIRLAVFAGLGKRQKTTYSWGLFRLVRYNATPKIKDSPPTMQGRGVVTGGTPLGLCGFSTDNRIGNQITA